MLDSNLFLFMMIGLLGIGSQWVAWRFQWPSIVVMSVVGLLAGPIFGFMNPEETFAGVYDPIISIAVAIILFEGSLKLSFREIKGLERSVVRIVTLGAFLGWILGSFTAHYVAGLSWAVSFVIGGLLIVTGPTVVLPMLRQAKLKPRPASILKWEGIIVDPLGALLAVFSYEIIRFLVLEKVSVTELLLFFLVSGFAVLLGWLLGWCIAWMFKHGYIPEFLKSPIVFVVVILCFTIPNEIMHETGLLSVTAMGVTMANMNISSINDMRHFKENISVLLISAIFIMLTASLSLDTLLSMMEMEILWYVILMLFIVRPLSILLSTIRTELSLKERILVGWIAPRGIVALTVSGYFASVLVAEGFEDASILVPLTFGLVFSTVVVHGFSITWLAQKLGIAANATPGVLIVGSNHFTIKLASAFRDLEVPVLLTEASWERVQLAKQNDFKKVYYGEILSEKTEYRLDLTPYDKLVAATELDSYNALVSTNFMAEFGRSNVYQLSLKSDEEGHLNDLAHTTHGNILFEEGMSWEALTKRIEHGFVFQAEELSESFTLKDYEAQLPDDSVMIAILKNEGSVQFFTSENKLEGQPGDKVLSLVTRQET
ncbi:sodium/hydrogen exchanger [Thalassobacillus devorans]|uniref:Sodium/hydrogen exchanger n=1 Tax=Thalassobacillus devorans TaxID=279813 RepID=A0ABQ1PSD8_9BACI|nr:sodium:proton antiporter [Thalassobacillus devorans]NIK30561.1 NhaP-type Na+/H+ or K+/H+ antiporter [Thalassobacillus devorans]GGD01962.1 sodium/hydrogen exchanger [Thalassobacillus devorans]